MKKLLMSLGLVLMMVFVLVGCGSADDVTDDNDGYQGIENGSAEIREDEVGEVTEMIQVVATFSIIADMVEQVGGDLVEVTTLVPIGEDPHEHEVLPADMMAVEHADVILYNGLNLETGYEWFENLMAATNQAAGVDYFVVTDGIQALYLTTEGLEEYHDPHVWLDIENGMIYVQNIANILSEVAPEHAEEFASNAATYIEQLQALHNEWVGRFDDISEDERMIVTAEGAFRYFGYAFNIHTDYIWEINAEDEGTPEQMIRIVGIVNDSGINYLFTESSVDYQYIEQVSEETGIPIFGTLFTDSLSDANGPAATYYAMMRHNLEMVYAALSGE